jgi:hypothetical protein
MTPWFYWSSTSCFENEGSARGVASDNGRIDGKRKSGSCYVRAVHTIK